MGINILVADDSITIQKVIGIIFGGDEYSLVIVDNGKAAVEKAVEITPDILLIDALMPGMNGYEVCEAVRAIPELAAKPILVLTGSFEPFDEERALKCGADDFIAKPFESQQIISKVTELLELGRRRESAILASSVKEETETISSAMPDDLFAPGATPVLMPAPEAEHLDAPTDIWSAFISDTVQEEEVPHSPDSFVQIMPEEVAIEQDIFDIISEESDAQLVTQNLPIAPAPLHESTRWQPIDESSFDFSEESETPVPPVHSDTSPTESATEEFSFGAYTPVIPPAPEKTDAPPLDFLSSFDSEEPAKEPQVLPLATPVVPGVLPPSLSEEQLRAAITAASKEVIERIVWEVVPDLAEAMIKEAIRQIKEGK